jgi:segregation and condensation protein A
MILDKDIVAFEGAAPGDSDEDGQFLLDLDGYGGPIDVLLTLARDQKVDLTKISILALAEQYLAFIERARKLRLELAADYLVMASWLAYLKSRLLLPQPDSDEEPSAAEMADALAFQLRRLESMQQFGARLMAQPQLGRDIHKRGAPEPIIVDRRNMFTLGLFELLSTYGQHLGRHDKALYTIEPFMLHSVETAIERLSQMIGRLPGWTLLSQFLPSYDPGQVGGGEQRRLVGRSAVAATFGATLELAKRGVVAIRQDGNFQPIYIRLIEALIFASAEPVPEKILLQHCVEGVSLRAVLNRLQTDYAGRGVNLVERDGAWAFRTAADLAGQLKIEKTQIRKLSRATVETLAIIAYHQPVSRAEIETIRGVAVARGTLDILIEADWIKPGKRRDTPGRPGTWVTTQGFLDHFALTGLTDLPGVEELKIAGLLDKRPSIQALTEPDIPDDEAETDELTGSLF